MDGWMNRAATHIQSEPRSEGDGPGSRGTTTKGYVGQRGLQEGKGRWVGGCVGEQMDGWTDTKTTSGTWASVDFRKVRDGGWSVVWVNKWMSDRYQDNKWYVGQRGLQEGKGRWVVGCVGEQMDE